MSLVAWVAVVAAAAGAAWLYSRWRHNYWAARGVTTPPVMPFLGHLHKVFSINPGRFKFDYEVYTKYGGSRYCGLYEMHNPVLFTGDLDLMKHVLVKDFDHFTDRRSFKMTGKRDKVIADMLSIKVGHEWKALRSMMSPTFTSGKIRSMFPLVCEKADSLVSYTLKQASEKPHVEIKDNYGRFTMDTIASCAFGIECNSFKNKNAEFAKNASEFFDYGPKKMLKLLMIIIAPRLFTFLKMDFNGPEIDFFSNVVEKTISMRQDEKKRGDFLDLLREAQASETNNNDSIHVMSDNSIVSQSVLFLVAGYDTTASTLAFSSYELSKNPHEQERLREELLEMMKEGDGELTYQGIMEAKFLDACIMETLRMYPPLVTTERVCTKPYQLPDTDLHMKPGDLIQIPIWCVHHDPRYWPDPDQFRPDRFMPENKAKIKSFTHLPFGMGPRNCLAMRFALMEAKVALAKMVLATKMSLAAGQEQLELVTGGGVIRPKHGIKLLIQPLTCVSEE